MQFITTDQRIAVENFEVGLIYTVTFSNGDSFTGACIGIGPDFVAFQRTAPKLLFCLTMTTAADIAGIDPLGDDIGKILEYTGTVPVSIKTDGSPLLDYLITGNTIQNGTPTPDSPVMPQGCGERTAQLIPYPFYSSDGEYAGVQFTTDNGRVIANGTLTSGLLYYLWRPAKFPAGTYTMSVKGKHSGATIYFRDTTHNVSVAFIYGAQEGDRSVTFTVTEEISAMVYINAGSGTLDFDCTIMLNTGEEALPFEPFGVKIPISSASTTTPVYLGEVQSTRRIKKLVFDGTENWTVTSLTGVTRFSRYVSGITDKQGICSHYKWLTQTGGTDHYYSSTNYLFIFSETITTETDFKAYLAAQYAAGTPVTVWYVLAEPTTGIVNEPLMRIGDYADTLSNRQSGVNIPTTDGLNIFDIDTTVKPSEVYLKYFSPLF